MIGHYKRSKYLAEEVAREAAAAGMSVVIVNPSTPVGPGDIKPTPTGQLVLDAAVGPHAGLRGYGTQYRARGRRRRRASAGVRTRQVGRALHFGRRGHDPADHSRRRSRGLVGRKPPRIRLPYAAVLPIAYVAEGFAKISGRSGRVTLEGVRMSRKRMFFSSAKAVRELGYRWRPPLRGVRGCGALVSRARPVGLSGGLLRQQLSSVHE